MDVLSDVLSAARLTGAIFFDHHVQGPFAGASPASEAIAGKVRAPSTSSNFTLCYRDHAGRR
jgi:hypothetical protein